VWLAIYILAKSGHNGRLKKASKVLLYMAFVTAKSRHNAAGFRKLQKSGLAGFF
jgi:hypothetical protein